MAAGSPSPSAVTPSAVSTPAPQVGTQGPGISIQPGDGGVTISQPAAAGIHKIKHVVVVMQENRSFDHYFGTFPV